MLTLAFSQMFYAVTFQAAWLGAEDGLVGVPAAAAPRAGASASPAALPRSTSSCSWPRRALPVRASSARRSATCSAASTTTRGAWRRWATRSTATSSSPSSSAGRWRAWRARSTRQLVGSISPDAFLWTTSGEALLMVIIGGTGTLGGSMLGAAAFILLQSMVSSYTERWMLILGLDFVLLVLFAPGRHPGRPARPRGDPLVTPSRAAPRHRRPRRATSARSPRSTACRSPSAPASGAPSSGPTGQGRPRSSTSSRDSSRPQRGPHPLRRRAGRGAAAARAGAAGIGRSFQRTNLFLEAHRAGEPPAGRRRRRARQLRSPRQRRAAAGAARARAPRRRRRSASRAGWAS